MIKAMLGKTITLVVFAVLSSGTICAQTDTAVSLVRYSFAHLQDTTDPSEVYTDDMVLYLGKQESVYQSYDRIRWKKQIRKMIDDRKQLSPEQQRATPIVIPEDSKMGSPEYYYKNTSAATMRSVEDIVGNIFVVEEALPAISWKIEADTKAIGGYTCQRATTFFKGRNYVAWFTPQIPYPNGPWKLCGLPGLILEAYDTRRQVVFSFSGFEGTLTEPVLIEVDKRARPATAKDLKRIHETAEKNMAAMAAGNAGGQGSLLAKGGSSSAPQKKKVINNPIELREQ